MSWLTRLRNLYRADRLSSDIDREMAFHLAQRTDDLIAMGYSPQAALDEARRRFGNVGMQKENTRERDVFSWLESFAADLAYAFRRIRESPGFATVAILSLALGIGATTTVYSAVTAVMLRPIAASDANRLAYVSMG